MQEKLESRTLNMSKKVKDLIVKNKNYSRAAALFVSGQICDSLSTYDFVSKFGSSAEANPRVRWLIENLGNPEGILADNLLTQPLILTGTYFLNKFVKSEKGLNTNIPLGDIALYAFGAASYAAALYNLNAVYNFL